MKNTIKNLQEIYLEDCTPLYCAETGQYEYDDEDWQESKEFAENELLENYTDYFDDLNEEDFEDDIDFQNEKELRVKQFLEENI